MTLLTGCSGNIWVVLLRSGGRRTVLSLLTMCSCLASTGENHPTVRNQCSNESIQSGSEAEPGREAPSHSFSAEIALLALIAFSVRLNEVIQSVNKQSG